MFHLLQLHTTRFLAHNFTHAVHSPNEVTYSHHARRDTTRHRPPTDPQPTRAPAKRRNLPRARTAPPQPPLVVCVVSPLSRDSGGGDRSGGGGACCGVGGGGVTGVMSYRGSWRPGDSDDRGRERKRARRPRGLRSPLPSPLLWNSRHSETATRRHGGRATDERYGRRKCDDASVEERAARSEERARLGARSNGPMRHHPLRALRSAGRGRCVLKCLA